MADGVPLGSAAQGIVRQPTPDEFAAFLHLERRGFAHGEGTLTHATTDAADRSASDLVRERESARALFVDGEPVAGLYLTPFHTFWGQRMVALEGVGGVTALPEVRRQGYTEALVAGALADMRDRRVPLSAITTPFSYGFYRKMGWGYAFRRVEIRFPPRVGRVLGQRATGHARFVRLTDAELGAGRLPEALDRVYRTSLAPRYHALAQRSAALWREHVRGDRTYVYVWDKAGEPQGYGILIPHEDELQVRELVWQGTDALFGLLGLCGQFDSQVHTVRVEVPVDVRLDALLADMDEVTVQIHPRGMLRIVDLLAAWAAREFRGPDGAVLLEVSDRLAPWNDGAFALRLHNGQATVSPAGSEDRMLPAARLDIATLSSLYAGDLRPAEACALGLAIMDNDAVRLLEAWLAVGTKPLHLEWY